MKNTNTLTFPQDPKPRENGRKWNEHYQRNNNRGKILHIAEEIFIRRMSTLDGNSFFDENNAATIAVQCLKMGQTFVSEMFEQLWNQDAEKDPGDATE